MDRPRDSTDRRDPPRDPGAPPDGLRSSAVTQHLERLRQGDSDAYDAIIALLYDDLRQLAARELRHERRDHTLQPTALVHELYARLLGDRPDHWADRGRFLAAAVSAMRRILVDHARARLRAKRGGGHGHAALHSGIAAPEPGLAPLDVIALDDALTQLAREDARAARVVELLYLAGLTSKETGELLAISSRTVERDWRRARAFLLDALAASRQGTGEPEPVHRLLRRRRRPARPAAAGSDDRRMPRQLGRYRLERPLGRGGMGEVYLAHDPTLDRHVAIKVLRRRARVPRLDADQIEREARLLASLNHPGIATIHSLESHRRTAFLTMEHLEGTTLAERLLGEAPPLDEALRMGRDVARALEAAHARDVIHLDLKPANVMVTVDGRVKVLDFGLGHWLRREGAPGARAGGRPAARPQRRRRHEVPSPSPAAGTPGYMSPEQERGDGVGPPADVWALGCLLFELFTGVRAMPASSSGRPHAPRPEPDWSRLPTEVDDSLRSTLARCLAVDPAVRPSAGLVARAIEEELAHRAADGTAYGTRRTAARPLHGDAGLPDHNLPAARDRHVGREDLLQQVTATLGAGQLITLTGSGGIGKSRLALEAARALAATGGIPSAATGPPPQRFESIRLVDLAAIATGDSLTAPVATAFDLTVTSSEDLIEQLARRAAERPTLLILDSCEHLLDTCAPWVAGLLDRAPAIAVLATSRERLGVSGERVVRVPPLPVPAPPHPPATRAAALAHLATFPAIELFLDRLRASRPDLQLQPDDAPALLRINVRLDGIPLAIELAAARAAALSLGELDRQLATGLQHAVSARRDVAERHRTLSTTIAWSHSLLAEPERLLFRRCAAFAGGWTADAAEEVAAFGALERWQITDALLGLVEKSLLEVEPRGGSAVRGTDTPDRVLRYRMLEPVRAFAARQLAQSGEERAVIEHHVDWMLALAGEAAPRLGGAHQEAWFSLLEEERDNLRIALSRALTSGLELRAMHLATRLGLFWLVRGDWLEAARLYGAVLEAVPEQAARAAGNRNATLRANAIIWSGNIAINLGDLQAARRHYEAALEAGRRLGDRMITGRALTNLGAVALHMLDLDRAERVLGEALEVQRVLGDEAEIAVVLLNLGVVAERRGDIDAAARHYAASLERRRRLGDRRSIALSLNNLGAIEEKRGDLAAATRHHEEALEIRRALGDLRGTAESLHNLGTIALLDDDAGRSLTLYRQGLEHRARSGDRPGVADSLDAIAMAIAAGGGDLGHALVLVGGAEQLREEFGLRRTPTPEGEIRRLLDRARAELPAATVAARLETGRRTPTAALVEQLLAAGEAP
jgi:non-specific serine/threonine protein kinase